MVDSDSVSNGMSTCIEREPGAALEAATGREQKQEECPGAFAWSGQQGAAEDCPLLLTALGERPGWCSATRASTGAGKEIRRLARGII